MTVDLRRGAPRRRVMKRGLYLAPFDEFAYPPPDRAVADPWVSLSAIASVTDSLRIGPMITPLSRRRVQKVARETVTLDRLSNGRLTLGVGLGNADDLEPFGEVIDPRERARMLDEGLERLDGFWRGGFNPLPVQRPRIP